MLVRHCAMDDHYYPDIMQVVYVRTLLQGCKQLVGVVLTVGGGDSSLC